MDYDGIDESTRQLVEAKLRRRDREAARREGRLPAAFMDDEDDDLLNQRGFQVRRRRKADDDDLDGMIDDLDGVPELPDDELLNVKGRLSDWIQNSGPRLLIRKTFKQFLTSFVDDNGESVYGARIKFMCESKFFNVRRDRERSIFPILT